MSDAFDPYHKWLGIPPAEQPPNLYRLLGIKVCEDDPDVMNDFALTRIPLGEMGPSIYESYIPAAAAAAGADHTILYNDVDFADAVREIAGEDPGIMKPKHTMAVGQ